MPRWTVELSVKINEMDHTVTPQGPMPYIKSQTTYQCGGDSHGDSPNNAVGEVLAKLSTFLQRQSLPEFEVGRKES